MYLNGHPFTVIGIVPATFAGTVFATETDFWAPLMVVDFNMTDLLCMRLCVELSQV
jgi:hypothetical protein